MKITHLYLFIVFSAFLFILLCYDFGKVATHSIFGGGETAPLTTIYLIRHGETDYNKDERVMGKLDIPLNDNGRLQATKLKNSISKIIARGEPGFEPSVIYSSSSSRALETANIINQVLALQIKPSDKLQEADAGMFSGLHIDDIIKLLRTAKYGTLVEPSLKLIDLPHFNETKNKLIRQYHHIVNSKDEYADIRRNNISMDVIRSEESYNEHYNRVINEFQKIVSENIGKTIIIVAHSGSIQIIGNFISGKYMPSVHNCSVSAIRYFDAKSQVKNRKYYDLLYWDKQKLELSTNHKSH